jgi:RimJ/RimL family protein N-acetyltransferase
MLRGERVLLRALERDDLPALQAIRNDLEIESLASDQRPTPVSLAQLQARFDARASQPADGVVRLVIDLAGTVIGDAQLHTFDDFSLTCHLGIALSSEHLGVGYGSEAITLLVAYAFEHLHVRKVCLEVLAHDGRAVGAYRKAGFGEEGRFREQAWHRGEYRDVLRMAVFAPGAAPGAGSYS